VFSSIFPASGSPGTTVAVTLRGDEFAPGSSIFVSGNGITVNPINVTGLGTLLVNFNIAPGADLGDHAVSITTAGGTSGSFTFTVQ
jgi:IPT/TIG domain-containing protein